MPRVDLQVSFQEKDLVKRLGAKWDPLKKVWFVPDGIDLLPFKEWLPVQIEPNIRSDTFIIAESVRTCWKCDKETSVFGLLMPCGHEVYEDGKWFKQIHSAFIWYVQDLAENVQEVITDLSQRKYHVDYSQTTENHYWMNHCQFCGMKQGDFNLYEECDCAFSPIYRETMAKIKFHHFDDDFSGNFGSCSVGNQFYLFAQEDDRYDDVPDVPKKHTAKTKLSVWQWLRSLWSK